jgi:hypothetical protein
VSAAVNYLDRAEEEDVGEIRDLRKRGDLKDDSGVLVQPQKHPVGKEFYDVQYEVRSLFTFYIESIFNPMYSFTRAR